MSNENSPLILPVRLEHQLAEELDAAREARNMSRNAFVIEAVQAALGAQPDLKFRIAELAMRELLLFVGAAQDGGVMDHNTARSLTAAINGARRSMVSVDHISPQRGSRKWSRAEPHGLALLATEPLREFVNKFRALCPSPDMPKEQGEKSDQVPKSKKVKQRNPRM
jgi:hypothetical protein